MNINISLANCGNAWTSLDYNKQVATPIFDQEGEDLSHFRISFIENPFFHQQAVRFEQLSLLEEYSKVLILNM